MSPVACPSCGEKGNIPSQLIGKRIKCQKCGTSFQTGSQASAPPVAPKAIESAKPADDGSIEVDGLDASSWSSTTAAAVATVAVEAPAPAKATAPHEPSPAFTASPLEAEHHDAPARQYKVLTSKDRWFEGKFELAKLEEALNHYARQGWVVRAMSTPHVTGFSGGPREELVILMER